MAFPHVVQHRQRIMDLQREQYSLIDSAAQLQSRYQYEMNVRSLLVAWRGNWHHHVTSRFSMDIKNEIFMWLFSTHHAWISYPPLARRIYPGDDYPILPYDELHPYEEDFDLRFIFRRGLETEEPWRYMVMNSTLRRANLILYAERGSLSIKVYRYDMLNQYMKAILNIRTRI